MPEPLIDVCYDAGYFDKDEQGWCARWNEIKEAAGLVTVRQWGDDNGIRGYNESKTYHRGPFLEELGLVRLLDNHGRPAAYFDLAKTRIISAAEQDSIRFVPPPDYAAPATLDELAAILLPVARALGIAAPALPPSFDLPPLTPSPTCEGAVETHATWQSTAARWSWYRRVLSNGDPQLNLVIEHAGRHASVFVQSPDLAWFLLCGSPEDVRPASVQQARQAAIAAWSGAR
jgi:hypothetical protein